MALLHVVYRDALFPRPAYRQAWERLLAAGDARAACRTMVGLLALANDRACEAVLADALDEGGIPNLEALRARFGATTTIRAPDVVVTLPPLASYNALLPSMAILPGATA